MERMQNSGITRRMANIPILAILCSQTVKQSSTGTTRLEPFPHAKEAYQVSEFHHLWVNEFLLSQAIEQNDSLLSRATYTTQHTPGIIHIMQEQNHCKVHIIPTRAIHTQNIFAAQIAMVA